MNTRLDYLWEKVSLFTQFSDLAKIFEPIFFKISLKTGPIFDHPLLVKIGSEIQKSVQNRKTDIFSSPGYDDGNDVTESDDSYDEYTYTSDDGDDVDDDEILTVECNNSVIINFNDK